MKQLPATKPHGEYVKEVKKLFQGTRFTALEAYLSNRLPEHLIVIYWLFSLAQNIFYYACLPY
jgi:hypothetical protein